jgi:hypothetical protein
MGAAERPRSLILVVQGTSFLNPSKDANVMQGVSMNGRQEPQIQSVEEMIGRFTGELLAQIPDWKIGLCDDPQRLQTFERTVHQAFARGADMLVAGLIAIAIADARFENASQRMRNGFSRPLHKGQERVVSIRLLGGLLIWVTTLYCAPKKKLFRKDDQPAVGLHTTLAQFGFGKGVSPGLQSRVARQVALCPSISFAHKELKREGVDLDVKAVKRITYQCGEGLLQVRRHRIELWRQGKLAAGDQFSGKHVSVQIDGGRLKVRGDLKVKTAAARISAEAAEGLATEDAPGRSRRKPSRTYDADWREPKLVTIFVHDDQGKMIKGSQATIDGTLLGPDAIAELVAMHLHRLGAAKALSVTFVADGAPWIWDRIDKMIQLAKLGDVPTHQVLDCCHAVHHISLALASLALSSEQRMPLYREHRSLLRNGQWRRVVEELSNLQNPEQPIKELETEISYLRRHGEAGRLSYVSYRRQGIPCGSGAIESSIRRVINLRLKSNAMFWKSENAELMLQVRCQVVTDQWDGAMANLAEYRRTQAPADWQWKPQPMSCKVEDSATLAV